MSRYIYLDLISRYIYLHISNWISRCICNISSYISTDEYNLYKWLSHRYMQYDDSISIHICNSIRLMIYTSVENFIFIVEIWISIVEIWISRYKCNMSSYISTNVHTSINAYLIHISIRAHTHGQADGRAGRQRRAPARASGAPLG